MTFREYLAKVNKFADENPIFLDLIVVKEVVNGEFVEVETCPVEGHYNVQYTSFTRYDYFEMETAEINAISLIENDNYQWRTT